MENTCKFVKTADADTMYTYESGMTDKLLAYEKNFESLRPRQQARLLWSRRFRRALRVSRTTQQELSKIINTPASSISSWANAVSMPKPYVMEKLSRFFGEDVTAWTEPEEKEDSAIKEASPVSTPSLTITEDEEALIRRVRRMSDEERAGLFMLIHVLR